MIDFFTLIGCMAVVIVVPAAVIVFFKKDS